MPIKWCSEQPSKTLEEFYQEVSANTAYDTIGVGKAMLRLIDVINQLFKETLIWGLTSHERMILQNVDNSASEWYVVIIGSELGVAGLPEYRFEYLVPSDKRLWKNALMTGEARSLAEAENYLLIAMRESGGLQDNVELHQLLAERKLLT
jgi:hypothetical protein